MFTNMYTAEVEDFIDEVENKGTPMSSGEEALKNFMMIQSTCKSQQTGGVVKVSR